MRHTRRQLDALRERLAATISTSVSVVAIDVTDAQGHVQQTQGYNVANLRAWVPSADAVELVELIARPGLVMMMAADTPTDDYTALPARDSGELLEGYAARCRELLP